MSPHPTRWRVACGQATAEFLVCALVLATLLTGLPVLQNFHRQQAQLILTARRAAFYGEWRHQRSDGVPGIAGSATQTLLGPLNLLGAVSGHSLDLNAQGYWRKQRRREVSAPDWAPEPYRGLKLQLQERQTQLGDSWNASGSAVVAQRAAALTIAARAAGASRWIAPVRGAVALIEPSIRRLCLGRVQPDIVPLDRLGATDANAPYAVEAGKC